MFGRVLCTKLGSDEIDDITIFTESDSNFCVDLTSTKDGKFITVNSNARTSSEERIYLLHVACFSNNIFMPANSSMRLTSSIFYYRFM